MLTVADMGVGGVKNDQKSADVLYGRSQTNKKTFAFLFIVTNHAVHEKNKVTAKLLIVGYLNQLQVGFDNYVTNHRKILNYAWVNFPLAYTQVVHMTVYAYFFATLFR